MAPRRHHQQKRRRKPTAARPSRGTIWKKPKPNPKPKPKPSSGGRGGESASRQSLFPKPTYFSLLRDVEHALRVDHTAGASMQKLKRDMEKKYGGKSFDTSSCKMLKSAVKRLQNRGRIIKHPNSSLLKSKTPIVPASTQ